MKTNKLIIIFLSVMLVLTATIMVGVKPAAAMTETQKMTIENFELNNVSAMLDKHLAGVEYQEVKAINPDQKVDIIIELDGLSQLQLSQENGVDVREYADSKEGLAMAKTMANTQEMIMNKIKQVCKDVKFEYTYTMLLYGLAANVRYGDIAAIAKVDEIKKISISEVYLVPQTIASAKQMNLQIAREQYGYTGNGMVIGVIDSGLDNRHEAFQVEPSKQKITKEFIANNIDKLIAKNGYKLEAFGEIHDAQYMPNGFTADEVYVNGKIPFEFDYADKDTDAIGYSSDHGTHVAGIAAGNNGDKEVKFRGAAYDAQILALKVFSDFTGGASTIDIIAALSDAVTLGVDAVNLSLGSAAGFSCEDYAVPYYDLARNAGVEICISAGNDYSAAYASKLDPGSRPFVVNSDFGVVATPSTYMQAISVASINTYQNSENYVMIGDRKIFYSEIPNRFFYNEFYMNNPSYIDPSEVAYVAVPNVGDVTDYIGLDIVGKIALVQRGVISFSDKVQIAADVGAIGCIIYDNVDGPLIRMEVTNYTIPGMFISLNDGETMKAAENKMLKLDRTFSKLLPYEMSDFSSWGPTNDLKIKPEITAPGGEINSSIRVQDNGDGTFTSPYGLMSGTSMASPNFAGASVIIREYVNEMFPNMAAKEKGIMVYKLAMSTASIVKDANDVAASPRKQGAGLVDVTAATTTKAYINVPNQEKPKIELGDDPDICGIFDLAFEVINFGDKTLTYYIDTQVLTEMIDEPFFALKAQDITKDCSFTVTVDGIVYDAINKIEVEANKVCQINIQLTLNEAVKNELLAYSTFNGGNFVEGFVVLEGVDTPKLSVPFMGFFGDWTCAPIFDFTIYDEFNMNTQTYNGIMWGFYANVGNVFAMGDYALNKYGVEGIPAPRADRIALAPDGNGYSVFQESYLGLLRNIEELTYTIEDAITGEIYYNEVYDKQKKSTYDPGYGIILPDIQQWQFDTAEAKACYENLPNNTQLIVTFTGITEFEAQHLDRESKCWKPSISLPMYIDNQKPETFEQDLNIWKTEDNRIMFSASVYDNHYVMAAWPVEMIVDEVGNPISTGSDLAQPIPVDAENIGETTLLTWDITDNIDLIHNGYIGIAMYDYAMNSTIMIISGVDVPTLPSPTKAELDTMYETIGVTERKQFGVRLFPRNFGWQNDYTIYWDAIDKNVATVDQNGIATGVSEGETTIVATIMWQENGKLQSLQAMSQLKIKPEPKEIYTSDLYLMINEIAEVEVMLGNYDEYAPQGETTIAFKDSTQTVASLINGTFVMGLAQGETDLIVTYKYINGKGEEVVLSAESHVSVSSEIYDGVYAPTSIRAYYGEGENRQELGFNFQCNVGDRIEFVVEADPWYASNEVKCFISAIMSGPEDCASFEGQTFVARTVGSGFMFIESLYERWAYVGSIFTIIDPNGGDGGGEVTPPPTEEFVISQGILYQYNGIGGDIVIPEGVVEIGPYVFYEREITSVVFPSTLKKIGDSAFCSNYKLEQLTIIEGVTTIEKNAFSMCSIMQLTLPNSLKYIGKRAFANNDLECKILILNEGLEYVGEYAFMENLNIETIVIPNSLVGVDFGLYQMTQDLNVRFEIAQGHKIFIQNEDSITNIYGEYLRYQGDSQAKVINIPDGIVRIGACAFATYEDDLATITINIPQSVKSIGAVAFYKREANFIFEGKAPILESE
ncbi:MAG: S8 family serine peptidase, partial [Clostridia bacterium]